MNCRWWIPLFVIVVAMPIDGARGDEPQWVEIENEYELAPPPMLRRRYGPVITHQEVVAEELERGVGNTPEFAWIQSRREQMAPYGVYGEGMWGPGFWGGGFWGPRWGWMGGWAPGYGRPGYWGWGGWGAGMVPTRGPIGYGTLMGPPAVAPWGPNTVTGGNGSRMREF